MSPLVSHIPTVVFSKLEASKAFIHSIASHVSAFDYLNLLWHFWDNVLLLQMGQTYLARFRDLAQAAERDSPPGIEETKHVNEWRSEQQAEWDRLSTSLALLGTMHAAILAIAPHPPPFAYAVWLGGAALSVCGLFIVQYFPVRAFSLTDEDIGAMVQDDNKHYQYGINAGLLAVAIASPIIIGLWASILFTVGMLDYIFQSDLGGRRYRAIAATPVIVGVLLVVATLLLGERIGRRVESRYKQELKINAAFHHTSI